jgi:hypothetical protein
MGVARGRSEEVYMMELDADTGRVGDGGGEADEQAEQRGQGQSRRRQRHRRGSKTKRGQKTRGPSSRTTRFESPTTNAVAAAAAAAPRKPRKKIVGKNRSARERARRQDTASKRPPDADLRKYVQIAEMPRDFSSLRKGMLDAWDQRQPWDRFEANAGQRGRQRARA